MKGKKTELNEIKTQQIRKKETIDQQNIQIEALENEFKETIWMQVYKKYDKDFKEAFAGVMKKDSFKKNYCWNLSTIHLQFWG